MRRYASGGRRARLFIVPMAAKGSSRRWEINSELKKTRVEAGDVLLRGIIGVADQTLRPGRDVFRI